MVNSSELKLTVLFLFVATLVAAVGAAFSTSNVDEQEKLGRAIHYLGMMAMLVGLSGIYVVRRSRLLLADELVQIVENDGKIEVRERLKRGVLVFSTATSAHKILTSLKPNQKQAVSVVIANGIAIDRQIATQISKLSNLRMLDLQQSIIEDEELSMLESLNELEWILLSGCKSKNQSKSIQMAFPEARICFDPRVVQTAIKF